MFSSMIITSLNPVSQNWPAEAEGGPCPGSVVLRVPRPSWWQAQETEG